MAWGFTAELWAHGEEPGSWHFVTLPADVSEEIRVTAEAAGPRRGFGSVRVQVTVGATTWRTSVFPESVGSYVLPVKRVVREAEGLEAGEPVTGSVEPV